MSEINNLNDNSKSLKQEGFLGQKMIVLPYNAEEEILKNPIVGSLYATDIGYYPYAKDHDRERKKGCPQYILIYCTEGCGWIYLDKIRYELSPNTYFIIPKMNAHHYGTYEEDPWSIYWIHFTGSKSDHLFERYADNLQPIVRPVPFSERHITLFYEIYYALENGLDSKNIEYANIRFFEFITSFIYGVTKKNFGPENDQVRESIDFMKANLDKSLTIEDLANQLQYSISHYSFLFKKATGTSPLHYFNQLKMQQACQYLSFTNLSSKEICFKLGFEDPYYFSRLFKKMMGFSPSKYRNTVSNKAS